MAPKEAIGSSSPSILPPVEASQILDKALQVKEYRLPIECVFFDGIGRPDVKEKVTQQEPWLYVTAELYGEGIKGQGGLGMLASDTLEVAAKLGIPMDCLTIFYRKERSYGVGGNFEQEIKYVDVAPEEKGFKDTGIDVVLSTKADSEVKFDVYLKKKGSVNIIAITEPNIGELYESNSGSDRRLYQNVALGFGGFKAEKALGIKPSMNQQLNESPTVFSALARLDEHLSEEKDFKKALSNVRKKTIYTNHTLVQAGEPEFALYQFEHFVLPNIKSEELKAWLIKKIKGKGDRIRLSTLAIELSGKKNGVSKIHAREASKTYKDYDGNKVEFDSVTNGIALDRWVAKDLLDIYRKYEVLSVLDLPKIEKIDSLKEGELKEVKIRNKEELKTYLRERKDQNGNSVVITEGAKIFNWRRRFADYKRPGMIFKNPEVLAFVLQSQNIDLVISGNVHPSDDQMKKELSRILNIVNGNEILKKRVHYVQDYDEALGKALSRGADVSINTPIVGKEACGTSGMKDVGNNVINISTNDGWYADPSIKAEEEGIIDYSPSYLRITGDTFEKEADSLYENMLRASAICDGKADITWGNFVKNQLREFLPIISGARMENDYINLGFPPPETIVFAA